MINIKHLLSLIVLFFSFQASSSAQNKPELRAVWIATVTNIDWPQKPTANTEEQKASFIRLLDFHKKNGFNCIIMQVRPATDAFYPSPYEPWSQWLTGKQGMPPSPYYDPLQFMIEETHKRGMEFHAWMNPYRAVFNIKSSNLSPTHITRIHPEWFVTYGEQRFFDPGNKQAQQYVIKVVEDVVRRYAIDAIHFDDYFYPYKIAGKEFPDVSSYSSSGTTLTKDAWRRSNTDSIIFGLSRAIHAINDECQFGISPFGVWRNIANDPTGSDTRAGGTNYDDLYADIRLWLQKGWIDYVMPQVYWEIGHPLADFSTIVNWWSRNTYGKNCYVGIGIYKAGTTTAWRNKDELGDQIRLVRNTANMQGMSFYSSKSLEKNVNGWTDSLRQNYFNIPASLPVAR